MPVTVAEEMQSGILFALVANFLQNAAESPFANTSTQTWLRNRSFNKPKRDSWKGRQKIPSFVTTKIAAALSVIV